MSGLGDLDYRDIGDWIGDLKYDLMKAEEEIERLRAALKEMSREDMTNHARDILNAALEGK